MLNSTQEQAVYLSHLWNRLSTQHIALGCSCSMSGISVTLEDFERDIADYLWAESERLGAKVVEDFLLAFGPLSEQDKPIRNILSRLEKLDSEDEVAKWLLPRMTKTIESYAKLHSLEPEALLMGGSTSWRKGYRN